MKKFILDGLLLSIHQKGSTETHLVLTVLNYIHPEVQNLNY